MTKLHNAQDAIKAAIEGGYELFDSGPVEIHDHSSSAWPMVYANKNGTNKLWPLSGILTDPLFWQALEKSSRWYAGEWKQKAMDYFQATVCDGETSDKFFQNLQ